MPPPIYVLALAAFVVGTQSYSFSGLLNELALDLGVSVASAGQLLSAFAVTSAVASPLVVSVLARFERRFVLITALSGVAVVNLVTASLPRFEWILLARVAVAFFSAAVIPMAGAIGARLVPPEKQGRALGVILGGLTVAFVVGIPFGTLVGGTYGWRATFVLAGVFAAAVIPAIGALVPRSSASYPPARVDWRVLNRPIVRLSLFLIGMAFVAAYPVLAFVGPLIELTTGFAGASVGAMQSVIGFGSMAGLIAGGWLADARPFLFSMRLLYTALCAIMVLWSVALGVAAPGNPTTAAMIGIVIFLTSAALIAPSPAIEKALVQADPERSSLTLAINTSVIYLGQGIGSGLGGGVVAALGYAPLGWAGGAIAGIALVVACLANPEWSKSDPRPRSTKPRKNQRVRSAKKG